MLFFNKGNLIVEGIFNIKSIVDRLEINESIHRFSENILLGNTEQLCCAKLNLHDQDLPGRPQYKIFRVI